MTAKPAPRRSPSLGMQQLEPGTYSVGVRSRTVHANQGNVTMAYIGEYTLTTSWQSFL